MKPIVVVGLQELGVDVLRQVTWQGGTVVSVARASDAEAFRDEFRALGVESVSTSSNLTDSALGSLIASAAVIVLTDDDDGANVDLALRIRKVRQDVPLIVRIFDSTLADYLRTAMQDVTVLSIAHIAAPVFVSLALQTANDDRSLAQARAARRRHLLPKSFSRRALDRVLVTAMACHLLLIVIATTYFAHALDLRLVDSLYFVTSTITTVGYGDITLRSASIPTKIVGMFLMFSGAAFVAVLFALFTGWVVDRRGDVLRGRVAVHGSGHIVVIGAGNVGFRVATALAERRLRVVIIERDAGRNAATLRAHGHHVIISDGVAEATLTLAGVPRARVVLALTDSDSTNLEIVVKLRHLAPGVPVVARFASPELSEHVSARGDAVTASSVAIASEKFAETALSLERGGAACLQRLSSRPSNVVGIGAQPTTVSIPSAGSSEASPASLSSGSRRS